ncbi:MAG: c-type cytochrome, partial [Vicinamibacterales bacterium]
MALLRVFAFALLMGVSALAQSPTRLRADASSGQAYGVGRTPTAEEIKAWDISIGPTGEELPPGKGTVR